MVDGLRRVKPLLIKAELLHAGLCLGLSEKSIETEKDRIKKKERQKKTKIKLI
jgi:hypothetical protein